jgi:Na+/H+-dicarboxylate symporter
VKNVSSKQAVIVVTEIVKEALERIIEAVNWGAHIGCKALLALLVTARGVREEHTLQRGVLLFLFNLYNCCVFKFCCVFIYVSFFQFNNHAWIIH